MMSPNLRPTELTISASALRSNVQVLRKRLQGRARMMAVVKADAYGHGLYDVAALALEGDSDMLGVAIAEEGIALRDGGIGAPILILGGASHAAARAAVAYRLSQTLFDIDTLRVMQQEAALRGITANIHLKIDTGMARVGIREEKDLEEMLAAIEGCSNIHVEGVYTHFADAVDDPEYTRMQNNVFLRAVQRVRVAGHTPIVHAAASAAFLQDETLWHDMVRPGIALYGAEVRGLCPELIPAQRLTTRPVRIQAIEQGATVGYGRTFTAREPMVIMTLPIGYGDGYPRILGNRAFVLVHGKRAPVVGRVCMDMIMADITHIPGVKMEDEVVLLGAQERECIAPDELAVLVDTIPYEIMLGFTTRIRRRFVQ